MLREIASNELFTVLLIAGLIVIAIAKLTDPRRFNEFILVIGNSKYLKIYAREQKFFDVFDALLFGNLVISSSVFIYVIFQFISESNQVSINALFKLAIGVASFFLIKVLIERLIGSLFEIDKLVDGYLFQKISYKNYLGILLLPMNAILLYSFKLSLPLIYTIIIILLIVNIIGLITSFKTYQSLIKQHFFYFILYLCALEIAPYIILYKVFMT
ncbi:DUF4271 domain-containing protein [Seonamhaeicola sediminis]|uniref:DUF4271 domain-containing protein n=1 Tax=Seonamhaeicola sediminis TaxID=2528206 RepID=A0A562YGT6_9FLAO|nr:DUF4271 domain-containing protein [Seonamhaeicola sediminis]TWO33744.1 DUF4271 domain-containing protein [Seonamhaeicola sediminis]